MWRPKSRFTLQVFSHMRHIQIFLSPSNISDIWDDIKLPIPSCDTRTKINIQHLILKYLILKYLNTDQIKNYAFSCGNTRHVLWAKFSRIRHIEMLRKHDWLQYAEPRYFSGYRCRCRESRLELRPWSWCSRSRTCPARACSRPTLKYSTKLLWLQNNYIIYQLYW